MVGKARRHLQRAADPCLEQRANVMRDAAYHDKKGADRSTAVSWWLRWTKARGVSPVQQTTVWSRACEQRAVEHLLEVFAVWLHDVRRVSAATVRAYVSTVTAWHHRRFGPMLPGYEPVRLRALLKGMRLSQVQRGGPSEERAVTTLELSRGTRELYDAGDVDVVTMCAAAQAGFCGLMRSAEYCVRGSAAFSPARLPTLGDLRFGRRGRWASFYIWPRKKGTKVKGKEFEVVLRDGKFLQPVRLLREMLRLRRARGAIRPDDPLFAVSGQALSAERLGSFVRDMVRAAGGDATRVGTHGLRRGGATAALAAGIDPATIQILGRWDSNVYRLYTQRTRRAAMRVGARVASTSF